MKEANICGSLYEVKEDIREYDQHSYLIKEYTPLEQEFQNQSKIVEVVGEYKRLENKTIYITPIRDPKTKKDITEKIFRAEKFHNKHSRESIDVVFGA
jgi:uncharacterized protein related to proFAR isomerase